MSKKAVVTGGAGFIGSHIVDALIDDGWNVEVVDSLCASTGEYVNKEATLHTVDIRSYEALESIFKDTDTVFHLAALPRVSYSIEHPKETHEVNVTGTLNVLMAARASNVRRVVFSTSAAVYGDLEIMPLSETAEPRPLSPYALHKYVGEEYMKLFSALYELETVSLRYFNVYGPRLDPHGAYALVIGAFLKQRSEGKPMTITGDGTQTRDFIHVRDIARANMLAATATQVGKGEVMNVGSGKETTINELAECIGGEVVYVEPRLEPHRSVADVSRAQSLLGWNAEISLNDGIAELKKNF